MSEDTLADASEDSLVDAGDAGEGKGVVGKAARIMVRALWQVEWSAAHPDAKPEERKAAWKASSEGRTEKVKEARKALRIMGKRGVTFTVATTAAGASDEDDD